MILGLINFSSSLMLAEAKRKPLIYVQVQTIQSITTSYTCERETCINARGMVPIAEESIACPRRIPFGSTVRIGDLVRRCDDRTNKRYDGRFDIFQRDLQTAKNYGKQVKDVTITYPQG